MVSMMVHKDMKNADDMTWHEIAMMMVNSPLNGVWWNGMSKLVSELTDEPDDNELKAALVNVINDSHLEAMVYPWLQAFTESRAYYYSDTVNKLRGVYSPTLKKLIKRIEK